MIQVLVIDHVDLINGKILAHNSKGTTYYLNYYDGILNRVPKIGDKVIAVIEGNFGYILSFVSNFVSNNEIHNFNELFYYIDEVNFLRFMKNLFQLSLDKGQLKIFDDDFVLSFDRIELRYKNGYIYSNGKDFKISCRFNEVFETLISINEKEIEISYIFSETIKNTIIITRNNEIKISVYNSISSIELDNAKIKVKSPMVEIDSPMVKITSPSVSFSATSLEIPNILSSTNNLGVFLSKLKSILEEIKTVFNTHTHSNNSMPPNNQIIFDTDF